MNRRHQVAPPPPPPLTSGKLLGAESERAVGLAPARGAGLACRGQATGRARGEKGAALLGCRGRGGEAAAGLSGRGAAVAAAAAAAARCLVRQRQDGCCCRSGCSGSSSSSSLRWRLRGPVGGCGAGGGVKWRRFGKGAGMACPAVESRRTISRCCMSS